MRVLHTIASTARSQGGPTAALEQMLRGLGARGVETSVASIRLPSEKNDPTSWPGEWRVFEPVLPTRWRASWGLGSWLVRHASDFDVVHVHGIWLFHTLASVWAAALRGTPCVVRPAGSLDEWSLRHKRHKKRIYYELVERRALDRVSAIHVTSAAERSSLEGLGYGSKTFLIPHSVELWQPRPQRSDGDPVFLFVGRLHPVKNIELILESAALLRNAGRRFRLRIAGDGVPDYRDRLRNMASSLGLDDTVEFLGFVSGESKRQAFLTAHAVVLASHQENFGVAVAEAMAAGLPVVVSDKVALARDVAAAGAGFVVRTEEGPSAFAHGMEKLLDPEARAQCGSSAWQLASQSFSAERQAERLVDMYRVVCGERMGAEIEL